MAQKRAVVRLYAGMGGKEMVFLSAPIISVSFWAIMLYNIRNYKMRKIERERPYEH